MWLSLACLGGVGCHRISTNHRTTPLPMGHITLCQQDTGNWKTERAAWFCTSKISISSCRRIRFHLYDMWHRSCQGSRLDLTMRASRSMSWSEWSDLMKLSKSSVELFSRSTAYPTGHNLNSAVVNSEPTCLSQSVSSFIYPPSKSLPSQSIVQFINGGSQFDIKDGRLQ